MIVQVWAVKSGAVKVIWCRWFSPAPCRCDPSRTGLSALDNEDNADPRWRELGTTIFAEAGDCYVALNAGRMTHDHRCEPWSPERDSNPQACGTRV